MKFDYMSWEAFATLITGISAVAAAFYVGLRQQKIAERQTLILQRQLSSSIFERKYAVYEATLALIKEAIQARNFPEKSDPEFLAQREKARFLFPDTVGDQLDIIRHQIILLEGHRDEATDGGGSSEVARAGRKAASEIVRDLRNLYPQVSKIFEDDVDMKSIRGL